MFMYRSLLSYFSPTVRQQGFSENPFGVAAIHITSLDDWKNLPKKISDGIESAFGGSRNNILSESTTFKMTTREFEELGIKIRDRVTLEINKYKIAKRSSGITNLNLMV